MNNKIDIMFKILVILLLIVIAYTSYKNMLYLEKIKDQLSVLPTFDFPSIKDSLKNIRDALDLNVWDIVR